MDWVNPEESIQLAKIGFSYSPDKVIVLVLLHRSQDVSYTYTVPPMSGVA